MLLMQQCRFVMILLNIAREVLVQDAVHGNDPDDLGDDGVVVMTMVLYTRVGARHMAYDDHDDE